LAHVAIVDDEESVARSTAALLEAHDHETSIHLSGEAFLGALPAIPQCCVLLDLLMPGMSGLEVQERLRAEGQSYPVVVLTAHGDVKAAVTAMKRGAVDFLEKPCSNEALLDAIDSGVNVLRRADYLTPKKRIEALQRIQRLTTREREVLARLVDGKINKVIAHELGISQRTVEIHRARIKSKLEARSLADIIEMARLAGAGPPA